MFILNEIVSARTEEALPTFTAFIDIAKAYDTVWRPGLWAKLKHAGVDPQTLDLLGSMLRSVCRRVLLQGEASKEFNVGLGMPQGSVLSPFLYASYIDGLHKTFRDQGLGVWVACRLVPLLMYADDIVLLAASPEALSASLRALSAYAADWRFEVNHGKSNVIVFGTEKVKALYANSLWVFGGREILRVSTSTSPSVQSSGAARRPASGTRCCPA